VIAVVKNNNWLFFGLSLGFFALIGWAVLSGDYFFALIPFGGLFLLAGWQSMQLVFLLLLFSLPFSMEYQVTETLGTDFPDELLMWLVAALFFCYWLYKPRAISRKVWSHPLILLLLLSIIWGVVCSLFSTQPLLSLKFLLAKGWYIGAFVIAPLILFRRKQMIRMAGWALSLAMVLVSLITLIRHGFYGYSFATINRALEPFFRNHVNYSAMLVCIIPIIAGYRSAVTSTPKKKIATVILILLLIALFLSYARGAWFALFVGIFIAWLIRKKRIIIAYSIVLVMVIGGLFWIKSEDRYLDFAHDYQTTIWHSDFREHLAATYQGKDVSTEERFYRWIAGLRMIKDKWLTGYGPNSFYRNYKSYTIPAFKTWVSNNPEHSTVHNYFLLTAVEQGIPGLLLFILLAGFLLYYAQHLYHRINDDFYKRVTMTIGIIMGMILTVNFLSDLIETDKIGSLFFLCLSMLVIVDLNTRLNPASDIESISQSIPQ
jgi:O-antigen ligase